MVDVNNDLKKMNVRSWRKIARDRDAWKFVLKRARIMHRPYKQRRRELRLSKWASGALAPRAVYFGRKNLKSRKIKIYETYRHYIVPFISLLSPIFNLKYEINNM